jgi:hypothetical protein
MIYADKAKLLMVKAKGLNGPDAVLDPGTIGLAVTLIKEIISLYQSCHRPAAMAAANMQKPGLVARRRLRKLIEARQLPEGVSVKQMQAAALEVGKTVTETDVVQMYEVTRNAG